MSVRLKYAGDKDISAGRSGGASIFALPGPVSFPPAGTILETLTAQTYPISEGGGYVTYNSTQYANQNADVYRKADGVGGNYLDWANAFNVVYSSAQFTTYSSNSADIIINGTNYGAGCSYYGDVYHDGAGGYTEVGTGGSCYSSGSSITSDSNAGSNSISTPVGTFTYESWTGNDYFHDGLGGYYSTYQGYTSQPDGAFIGTDSTGGSNQTEVPSGSGNSYTYSTWSSIDYYFQLSGYTYTYTYQGVVSANYGDYITNYSGTDYYWDGNGGYYS